MSVSSAGTFRSGVLGRAAHLFYALAVALAGIAVVANATAARADHTVDPEGNPDLGDSCGIDVVVILDESGSIGTEDDWETPLPSEITDVENAYEAFLNGLVNTGSQAGG